MWTEIAPQELIDSRVFPRICALCEIMWSDTAGRNYKEFHNRMQYHINASMKWVFNMAMNDLLNLQ